MASKNACVSAHDALQYTHRNTQPGVIMYQSAIYVFSNALCMEYGFTMFSRYFKTRAEAEAYQSQAGHKFFRIVEF